MDEAHGMDSLKNLICLDKTVRGFTMETVLEQGAETTESDFSKLSAEILGDSDNGATTESTLDIAPVTTETVKETVVAQDEKSAEKAKNKAEKHANFQRLAISRTRKTINDLRLIGNLGSGQYVRENDEIDKIEKKLYSAVEETIAKLRNTCIEEADLFTL